MTEETERLSTLRKSVEAGTACYLLVDPIMGDVLPGEEIPDGTGFEEIAAGRRKAWGRPVQVVELAKDIPLAPVFYPYLVSLEGADDPWLESSLDIAMEERRQSWQGGLVGAGQSLHKIGGWLKTTQRGDALAAMLGGWMRVNTAVRVPEKYLRLADPRVLALLRSILGAQVLQSRMGRLQSWLYLDAYGKLRTLTNAQSHLNDDRVNTRLPPLDAEQWERLSMGAVVHGALARAFGQVGNESADAQDEVPYAAAVSAAQRFALHQKSRAATSAAGALAGKIRDRNDVSAAVALTLLNAMWDTHPEVLQRLNEGSPEEGLAACCEDICACLRRPMTTA